MVQTLVYISSQIAPQTRYQMHFWNWENDNWSLNYRCCFLDP
uniref:Uncharacterized protein n=1 Tax=Arundo donax TaxID=35708 RepID=A0A0A9CA78_ARUDO